jgi:hypothetical protein
MPPARPRTGARLGRFHKLRLQPELSMHTAMTESVSLCVLMKY